MEQLETQDYATRQKPIKMLLLLIFVLSVFAGFALADSGQATAYGLANLTTSSPISPVPTPDSVRLDSVAPRQGANSVVGYVTIYGKYLRAGGQLYLRYSSNQEPVGGETEPSLISIHSIFIDSTRLVARIPKKVNERPLEPGYYDFVLAYGEKQATLVKAYRVLNAEDVDDLYAEPYHLSTVPSQLWVGEETKLTLRIHRLGGRGGTGPFNVDFYLNSVKPENRLGSATVPGVSPNSSAASSLVTWTPQFFGKAKIIAVIDADNAVAETEEDNNIVIIERKVALAQAEDTYPPVVSNLQINGGAKQVNQQQIALSATVEDHVDPNNAAAPVSGPTRIYYVELHWYNGIGNGSGSWIPVNWTSWLPYDGSTHDFVLHPTPGLRYLQAWGADAAGNISNLPDGRRLNYIPEEDEVSPGEIRVYRQEVDAGKCLNVKLTPSENHMDPDLYVWGPDGMLQGFSINGAGHQDEVVLQSTSAGAYQIEVEGFTNARYRLTINVQNECVAGGSAAIETRENAAKAPRIAPAIPVDNAPQVEQAPLPQEEITQSLVFVPTIHAAAGISVPQTQEKLFLPMLSVE